MAVLSQGTLGVGEQVDGAAGRQQIAWLPVGPCSEEIATQFSNADAALPGAHEYPK
jgi:hypothetical protein